MEIGFIGLGKMGSRIAFQLIKSGNRVLSWDLDPNVVQTQPHLDTRDTLQEILESLKERKVVWMMIPAGPHIDDLIEEMLPYLSNGDIIVDGGNSFYKDSVRRYEALKIKGASFIDCGTSGGLEGAEAGACIMVGGDMEAVQYCEPLFEAISVPGGYLHCGKSGSGHFVKMVHNGIEYGMMQAIGEGFEIMNRSRFNLKLDSVAQLFGNGSVIRSWLMDLTARALEADPSLSNISGVVGHSGEGKWAAEAALELEVPAPVITQAFQMRLRSAQMAGSFSTKVVAALRDEFGGHGYNEDID